MSRVCILSPCLFNFYEEYITWNAGLAEAQAGIKISRKNINNLRYADDTTLKAESEEEVKSHLMKVKKESEKAGLKLNILKNKIMASVPITSWQISGETMETVRDYFLRLQNHHRWWLHSHEIKRLLNIGRKALTNLDSVLKSRDITLLAKEQIGKGTDFPTIHARMWELDHKEHWRTDAFELCWRTLLRVPWTPRRSNQSILKEINPEYSLEGLMLKLKLQYFGHQIQRADSLEKTLMLGKIEGRRRRGEMVGWHHQWTITQWTWVWLNSGRWWRTGKPGLLHSMGLQRIGNNWAAEQQQIETTSRFFCPVHTDTLIKVQHKSRFREQGMAVTCRAL